MILFFHSPKRCVKNAIVKGDWLECKKCGLKLGSLHPRFVGEDLTQIFLYPRYRQYRFELPDKITNKYKLDMFN